MEFPGEAGVGRSICYSFKYFNIFSIHLNFKLKAPLVVSSSQMGSINWPVCILYCGYNVMILWGLVELVSLFENIYV